MLLCTKISRPHDFYTVIMWMTVAFLLIVLGLRSDTKGLVVCTCRKFQNFYKKKKEKNKQFGQVLDIMSQTYTSTSNKIRMQQFL